MKVISNFSAGVTSTIATKLAIDKYGIDNVRIIFFETGQHHPDNDRYIKECEDKIFNKKIEVFRNKRYDSPIHVALRDKYVNGPGGARCTLVLKKKIRQDLEKYIDYDYQVFGFEYAKKEMNRALRFKEQYPEANSIFPLVEERLTKKDCMNILVNKYNVELPTMYKLGYNNNNCIGCFKGGKGYWNKIRKDFPDIFQKTVEMEATVGHSCMKEVFLKDLKEGEGRHTDLDFDCGAFCQVEMKGLKIMDDLEALRLGICNE